MTVPATILVQSICRNKEKRTGALKIDRVRNLVANARVRDFNLVRVIAQRNQNCIGPVRRQPGFRCFGRTETTEHCFESRLGFVSQPEVGSILFEVFELKRFVGPPLEANASFMIFTQQTFRSFVPEDFAASPRHAAHARIESELHVILLLFIPDGMKFSDERFQELRPGSQSLAHALGYEPEINQ